MAVQVRGTTPQLYDNVDKDVFTLLFDAAKELQPIWKDLIDIRKSDRKFERVLSMTGVDTIPEKGEGSPYTSKIIREGWSKDFTHTEFGAMFEVTQTALEDDQFDQLAQHARWFMFAARVVEEQRAHILYNNGFSTEQSPDGVSLFNTAHVLKGGGTARGRPVPPPPSSPCPCRSAPARATWPRDRPALTACCAPCRRPSGRAPC